MYNQSSVRVFCFTNAPKRLKAFLLILYLQLYKKHNCLSMVYPRTVFSGILNPKQFYNVHVYVFLAQNSLSVQMPIYINTLS